MYDSNKKDKKNRRLRFGIGIITVALSLAIAIPSFSANVTIKASVKGAPEGKYIYKMEQSNLSKDQLINKINGVTSVLNNAQVASVNFNKLLDRFVYADEKIQTSINLTGDELYFTNFPGLKLDDVTGKLPSDEQSVEIAKEFLATCNLLPLNMEELKIDHVGGIDQAEATPTESFKPEKKAVVVYFYRELNGLRVMNYGSSITVTIGDSYEPVGLQYHWREVASMEKISKDMVVDMKNVSELIKNDINRVYAKDANITIDNIDLVYYDNGGKFIQPAFCYQGKYTLNGNNTMPVLGYVPALTHTFEPVHHPAYSPERENIIADVN